MKDGDSPVSNTTIEHKLEVSDGFGDKKPFLYVLSGPQVGRKYALVEARTKVGRSSKVTVTISDRQISREHFEIILDDQGALLRDLGSKNGTHINGVRLDEHRLRDGDKIQVSAETIMKFTLQDVTESHFHDRLYSMATRDPVTNAYNRRHFLEQFAEAFEFAVTEEQPLSLLMLDIDHFKAVNDTHGHLAGDEALRQLARWLRSELRSDDLLSRFGGEEFAVLLRDTPEERAVRIAERMRRTVQQSQVTWEDRSFNVTISIGVATHSVDCPFPNPEAIIREADTCLYISKDNGRNRTTCASDLQEETRVTLDDEE
jgi:two-component system cell cycle response regulator